MEVTDDGVGSPGKTGTNSAHCLASSWWPWVLREAASVAIRVQALSDKYCSFFYLVSFPFTPIN